MQRLKTLLVLITILLCLSPKAFANIPLSDEAEITLLTCGPGDQLYSVFGHTAIRVYDPVNALDTVYNFGTFDFDTPNFYLRFVKGDLQYYVSVTSYAEFMQEYIYYGRSVTEQILNITNSQKQYIADELNAILLSDRKFYTYKFIDRNCTTMVADIIAEAINSTISTRTNHKGQTYREIIYNTLHDNYFYENLGINILFGYKTDADTEKNFLPDELRQGIDNTTTNIGPLSKPALIVIEEDENKREGTWWNNYYTFAGAILLLMLASKNKVLQYSFLFITGSLGIFFCLMGFFSLHKELLVNYNALLFNPLFTAVLLCILMRKRKAAVTLVYICFASLILYFILMLNKPHLFEMLPLMALTVILLLRVAERQKNKLIAEKH